MILRFPRRGRYSHLTLLTCALALVVPFVFAARKPEEQTGPAAQLGKAPSYTRSLKNPYEGQPEAISAGRKLYGQHCAQCHGPEGHGIERAANLHSATVQEAPPGVLFWALRNGRIRKGMPAWSRLPDEQLWQLVSFIKTLK
jgi:mono/diheme cytochrome c family protein